LIIYGAYQPQRILATKWEECPRCGVIGVHGIRRHATWVHFFWVPLLLLWVGHQLICWNCGLSTKLGWRQVRAGLKTQQLVLDRPRPRFAAERKQHVDSWGRMPDEHKTFDPLTVNPQSSLWDLMIPVWLLGYVALIGLIVVTIVTR
jgi:hypothetical protein